MRHNHLWVPPTSCLIMLQFFKIVLWCPTPLLQISPFSELRISHSNAKRFPPQSIWLQLLPTLFLLFKSIVFYFLSNRFHHKTCFDHNCSKDNMLADHLWMRIQKMMMMYMTMVVLIEQRWWKGCFTLLPAVPSYASTMKNSSNSYLSAARQE